MTNREEMVVGAGVVCADVALKYLKKDVVLDEKMMFYLNNIIDTGKELYKYMENIFDTKKLISKVRSNLRKVVNTIPEIYEKQSEKIEVKVTNSEYELWDIIEPSVIMFEEFVIKSKTADIKIKSLCRKVICDWNLFVDYVAEGAR